MSKITKLNKRKVNSVTIEALKSCKLEFNEEWYKTAGKKKRMSWKMLDKKANTAGVYAFRLSSDYPGWKNLRPIKLHGPKTIGKIKYIPQKYNECKGWVYVGTAFTGIATRIKRHLSKHNKSGYIIYKGMRDFFNEKSPLEAALKYGTLYWIPLPKAENAANRFFIEAKLIAEIMPIFNVKSEH